MTFSIILSELQSAVTDKYLELNEVRSKWNQSMDLAKEFMLLIHKTKIPKICRVQIVEYFPRYCCSCFERLHSLLSKKRLETGISLLFFFFFFFFIV